MFLDTQKIPTPCFGNKGRNVLYLDLPFPLALHVRGRGGGGHTKSCDKRGIVVKKA
jgi:hypothetical protein